MPIWTTTHPVLQKLLQDRPWCVAGGYARCPSSAGDIDVWVFSQNWKDDVEELTTRCAGIPLNGRKFVKLNDSYGPNNLLGFPALKLGEYRPIEGAKLYRPIPIQIMLVQCSGPQELIDSFDISCHMRAYQGGTQYFGKHFSAEPQVIHPHGLQSYTRLDRLRKRYGYDSLILGAQ